ncbi:hypothetical protein Tco_1391102 [Tanacetum coccineum]
MLLGLGGQSTLPVGTRLSLPRLTMIITLLAGTTYLPVGTTTLPIFSLEPWRVTLEEFGGCQDEPLTVAIGGFGSHHNSHMQLKFLYGAIRVARQSWRVCNSTLYNLGITCRLQPKSFCCRRCLAGNVVVVAAGMPETLLLTL